MSVQHNKLRKRVYVSKILAYSFLKLYNL